MADFQVKVGALSAITDATGNFLLTNPPTGQQVILVDGPSDLYPLPSTCCAVR